MGVLSEAMALVAVSAATEMVVVVAAGMVGRVAWVGLPTCPAQSHPTLPTRAGEVRVRRRARKVVVVGRKSCRNFPATGH